MMLWHMTSDRQYINIKLTSAFNIRLHTPGLTVRLVHIIIDVYILQQTQHISVMSLANNRTPNILAPRPIKARL